MFLLSRYEDGSYFPSGGSAGGGLAEEEEGGEGSDQGGDQEADWTSINQQNLPDDTLQDQEEGVQDVNQEVDSYSNSQEQNEENNPGNDQRLPSRADPFIPQDFQAETPKVKMIQHATAQRVICIKNFIIYFSNNN